MVDDSEYGSKGQTWHPNFIRYMKFIANHENYKEMPDAFTKDDKIQWEAPSNRKSGIYKDTHAKRREWWKEKAISIGIDPYSNQWISKTAKSIHPTLKKPCKSCGKVMNIKYVYPSNLLLKRLSKIGYIDENFTIDPFEEITDLVIRLVNIFGNSVFLKLPELLNVKGILIPTTIKSNLEDWVTWIDQYYVPREPGMLSPGAMANPPDRFDGFHSFNACCRGTQDKGRSKENLQSYANDRRVFE
jgi:Alw26I/Eco31I/Esp3I family type II restriction endonuclease